ncbi:spr1629 family repressor/antitoxin [Lactococcus garvieae]
MFSGQKLTELRLLYNMSRAELASELGLTEQAVWQFETNKNSPKMIPTIVTLSRLFGVDISYFEETKELAHKEPDYIDTSVIAFRNGDANSKKTIQIQEVYLKRVHHLIKYFESFLVIPDRFIKVVEKECSNIILSNDLNFETIEVIASMVKEKLNVSLDNSDIMYKLELSGINVLSRIIDPDSKADAYSLWTKDDVPYIILGKNKSAVRRNFDLAHELGHLILHRHIEFDGLNKSELEKIEREANHFASHFLISDVEFSKAFNHYIQNRVSNPDSYIPMKKKYNISIQALEYRAFKLGLVSLKQNSYFYRQLTRKNYKVIEPLDLDIPIKKPGKIQNIIDLVLSNNLLTLKEFLSLEKISVSYLSRILDIKEDFFEKYSFDNKQEFSQIIQLKDHINDYHKRYDSKINSIKVKKK